MNIRNLVDRVENYTQIVNGKCACGESIVKVLGSSCTMWKNGDRYVEDMSASCIFRCRNCGNVIHENFIPFTA